MPRFTYSARNAMGRSVTGVQDAPSAADVVNDLRARGWLVLSIRQLVLQLVRVGEQTGTLEQVVTRAAETLERRRLLRTQLVTALAYPSIVVVAAIGVTVFMLTNVIPKLQVFLTALGRKLPPITQ